MANVNKEVVGAEAAVAKPMWAADPKTRQIFFVYINFLTSFNFLPGIIKLLYKGM